MPSQSGLANGDTVVVVVGASVEEGTIDGGGTVGLELVEVVGAASATSVVGGSASVAHPAATTATATIEARPLCITPTIGQPVICPTKLPPWSAGI